MSIVWRPADPEKSRMYQFTRHVEQQYQENLPTYAHLYQWSIQNTAAFWQALAQYFSIPFSSTPSSILTNGESMLGARWFSGATLNFTQVLLSRRDEKLALISVNEQGDRQTLSYAQLYQQISDCAAGLKKAGVVSGDRVAAILPNVSETIIAMLATASLGAVWSSCSPDFGAQAAIDRLGQIAPKLLFITDGHQYLGKQHEGLTKIKTIEQAIPSLVKIVVRPTLGLPMPKSPKLATWNDFLTPSHALTLDNYPFNHPLYILYSSGTTGKPKCIVHGVGGTLLQHLKELGLHTDLDEKDRLFFYTTCGWMMWNWMVSALALGVTLVLYEGAPTYPDVYRLFQLIEKEAITVFGTSAKFISALEKAQANPAQRFSLLSLRTILSTGSPLLPKNYDFVYQNIKQDIQLSSISGGTDIVSCFALGNPLLPIYRGEIQCIGLGMDVKIVNEQGEIVQGERGELVCTQAFPSMPLYFWNDPNQLVYTKAYFSRFPGKWAHGDFAEITPHHGLIIYGRSDTVLNPGGVRIGTAEIYRQVEKIPEVSESLVIGQNWEEDIRIVLFVKLAKGIQLNEALQQRIRQIVRTEASPRHVPAKILQVQDIPRTLNGKIVELAVRQIVNGEAVQNLQSIANPEVLKEFRDRVELKT